MICPILGLRQAYFDWFLEYDHHDQGRCQVYHPDSDLAIFAVARVPFNVESPFDSDTYKKMAEGEITALVEAGLIKSPVIKEFTFGKDHMMRNLVWYYTDLGLKLRKLHEL